MYSGGLDSAGMLYQLLTEEQYANFSIHVHHVSLLNFQNREKAEMVATQKTTEIMQRIKPFKVTYGVVDYMFLSKMLLDTDTCAFVAGQISLTDRSIKHIAVGRQKDDLGNNTAREESVVKRDALLDSLFLYSKYPVPDMIYPVVHMTKKEIWDMLPADIRDASWSCRMPKYKGDTPTACGRCSPCMSLSQLN